MDIRHAGNQKRELSDIRNKPVIVWVPPKVDIVRD